MNSESERERQMNSEGKREARAPSILDLLRSAAATPTNSGQARGTSRDQKTTKSRRKEKHRRRANSLSLRRCR